MNYHSSSFSSSSSSSQEPQPPSHWHELSVDLLLDILGRLETLRDFYALRAVCRNWRVAAKPSPETLSSQLPLILIASRFQNGYAMAPFDIFLRRRYSLRIKNRLVLSYSHGHLVTIPTQTMGVFPHIELCNIFTGVNIGLPSFLHFSQRVLLSDHPDTNHCIVIRFKFMGNPSTIEYLKLGETRWSAASCPQFNLLQDMMFFRGRLLALVMQQPGRLELLEVQMIQHDRLTVGRFENSRVLSIPGFSYFWLVKMDETVLVVAMARSEDMRYGSMGVRFRIFRWDPKWNSEMEWEEIRKLGNRALFTNGSGPAALFPANGLIRRNCIYSIVKASNRAWVVYHLSYGTYKWNVIYDDPHFELSDIPSLWILPKDC